MIMNEYFYLIRNLMQHPNIFKNVYRMNREDIISIDLNMTSTKQISIQFVTIFGSFHFRWFYFFSSSLSLFGTGT